MRKLCFFVILLLLFTLVACTEKEPVGPATSEADVTTEAQTTEPETSAEVTTEAAPVIPPITEPLKISCLGDSLTNLDNHSKTYVSFLGSEEFPLVAQNVGLSGSAVGVVTGGNPAFAKRYTEINSDAEIILIFGGSNDFGHTMNPVTLGDPEGTDTDKKSFCGALRFLFETLREEHPEALIVYATPMKRNDPVFYKSVGIDPAKFTGVNKYGYTLEQYRDAGVLICEKYGIPCIDTYNHPVLNPLVEEALNSYFRDGLHTNDTGASILGAYFTEEIYKIWQKSQMDTNN